MHATAISSASSYSEFAGVANAASRRAGSGAHTLTHTRGTAPRPQSVNLLWHFPTYSRMVIYVHVQRTGAVGSRAASLARERWPPHAATLSAPPRNAFPSCLCAPAAGPVVCRLCLCVRTPPDHPFVRAPPQQTAALPGWPCLRVSRPNPPTPPPATPLPFRFGTWSEGTQPHLGAQVPSYRLL